MRRRRFGATLAAAAVALTAVVIATQGGGTVTANAWVNITAGGTPTACSPACPYDASKAYGSIDAAWDAVGSGAVVRIKASATSYGAQTITGNKTSATQVIGETSGSGVKTGTIDASGNFMYLQNVTQDTGSTHGAGFSVSASDVTFDNVNATGLYTRNAVNGATNWKWINSYLGIPNGKGAERDCTSGDDEPLSVTSSAGTLIRNVIFWPQGADITSAPGCPDGTFHLEMIRFNQGNTNTTVEESWFKDNDDSGTGSIFVTHLSGTPSGDGGFTFRNLIFGSTTGGSYGINFSSAEPTCANIDIAYNTSTGREVATLQCPTIGSNVTWTGNLGQRAASAPCTGTFVKNVWQDSQSTPKCGTDTIVIGTRFAVDQLGMTADGHLTSGSPARNAAEGTYCVAAKPGGLGAIDLDGGTRVAASNCDAGADEYGVP